jgi:photosystem II stability/assembly factor-like uncharacterized protein
MKSLLRRVASAFASSWLFSFGAAAEPPRLAVTPPVLTPRPVVSPKAANMHAVFKSLDQGLTWSFAGHGIGADNRSNALLALDRGALAGTDQGIFSSSDAENWKPVRAGVPRRARVRELLRDGDSVFAATAMHGVLRSSDSGATWSSANHGLLDASILSLARHRSQTFAGTDSQGVFVTEDDGGSWRRLGDGLPDHSQVFDLQMVGDELFAGLYSKGVFKLASESDRWEKAGDVKPLQLAATPATLFAGHNPGGIWTSQDRGQTWRETGIGLPATTPVWVLANEGDAVFAGTRVSGHGDLYVSRNEGVLWMKSDAGLPEQSSVVSIAVGKDYVLAGVLVNRVR